MALNATEKTALEALAAELDTVSTWHTGPRADKVTGLADKLRNFSEEADTLAAEQKAREEAAAEAERLAAEAEKANAKK